jgi:hypothetical protein
VINLDKINTLLNRKNDSFADVRDELVGLVENHPYSGPFRMLLAKASKDAGHLDQRKDLLAAAAHCESRKALFELMFGESFREEARKIHKIIEEADEVSEEEMVELVWHSNNPNEEDITIERETAIVAIESSLKEEMEGWKLDENDKKGKKTLTEEGEKKIFSKNISPNVKGEKSLKNEDNISGEIIEIKGRGDANSLFGKWLEKRALEISFGEVGDSNSLLEQGAAAIIDAFLKKKNPSIGEIKDVDSPVEEWANRGLAYDPSLVTETMAKLYAKQGQIGRARKAFKMLALKYPEKSVYFASQLKKLSNN